MLWSQWGVGYPTESYTLNPGRPIRLRHDSFTKVVEYQEGPNPLWSDVNRAEGGREILLTYNAQHCFLFDIEGMTVLKGTTMFQKAAQHFVTKPQNFGF